MKSHGVLFTAPMVRALLDGRKSQTRRLLAPANSLLDGYGVGSVLKQDWLMLNWHKAWLDHGPSPAGNRGPYWHVRMPPRRSFPDETWHRVYPRIQAGDEIWAKENYKHYANSYGGVCTPTANVIYAADDSSAQIPLEDPPVRKNWETWQPSLLMPRWCARIVLEVISVRSERLNDISPEDALAEGISHYIPDAAAKWLGEREADPVKEYRDLWESINGENSWLINPFVWVYDFKRK